MFKIHIPLFHDRHKIVVRVAYVLLLMLCVFGSFAALFVIETKQSAFDIALLDHTQIPTPQVEETILVEPFPLGVDPRIEAIEEQPDVEVFLETKITSLTKDRSSLSWWKRNITERLTLFDWYQNLASPISRVLVIRAGDRKEEVIHSFGNILRWDTAKRKEFEALIASSTPAIAEGKFFPGRYSVVKDETPQQVAERVLSAFEKEVGSRYTQEIDAVVPFEDAMKIASLLEREAYDFTDMRLISGVIWNRLFAGMNLQLDATLQYARANKGGKEWWPVPVPDDKYIKSPYNTYQNGGLPPTPIANPSPEAILAALNPKETECIFYFHDKRANFHCTKTYEEHVALLKKYYGRGK
jgi:cell division protein YceG involved in septum cleavage